MIAIALGKKGMGKSALIRKLVCRLTAQRRATFFHDPQEQVSTANVGRVYTSIGQWRADARPTYLSVFREVELEEVAALALQVRDVTLAADELDRATNGKSWLSPSTKRIVHEGRHYRVSLLGAFRRTANVSEDMLSQTDYAALFHTSAGSPYDLQAIGKRFGPAYAEAVTTLENGQFVVWSDD